MCTLTLRKLCVRWIRRKNDEKIGSKNGNYEVREDVIDFSQ